MSVDDIRNRILDAAGAIFADKGFNRTTVRDICQRAGVNLAAVNYYFGDKQRLYLETVTLAHQMRSEEVPLPKWADGTPAEEKLRAFVATIMARMVGLDAAPWQTRLLTREVIHPTDACTELVKDYFRPQMDVLLGILDEILPPDVSCHRRQQVAFSILGQCLLYRVAGEVVSLMVPEDELKSHYTVEELAEHIAEFSLAALGLARPLGQKGTSRILRFEPMGASSGLPNAEK